MKDIAIIKYNAGNIRSVLFALERLGLTAKVTDDHEAIKNASHVIFPGQGAANSTMPYLKERGLDVVMKNLTQPFLGICLGMQLMCRHTEEGDTDCLGIFDLGLKKFTQGKVPLIGWNKNWETKNPLFNNIPEGSFCYFVHSYYVELGIDTAAISNYYIPYSSAVQKDNFYGVQFHPEKSADIGEKILRNFLSL